MGRQAMTERASKILDKDVKDQKGEDVGKVNDLLMNRNGQVEYLIVSQGGVLGIGDKLIPIPFRMARVDTKNDNVVLMNIDKEKLEKAPHFASDKWNEMNTADFDKRIHSYYGAERRQHEGKQER
jgi:sporulation protein YlmC with PRC-barrel domain